MAVGYLGAGKGLLSALLSGDKLKWKTAGGDYMELWSDITAAGLTLDKFEDWATDNRALYPAIDGSGTNNLLGGAYYSSANHWIDTSGDVRNPSAYRPTWGTYLDTAKVTLRGQLTTGSNPTIRLGYAVALGATFYLVVSGSAGAIDFQEPGTTTGLAASGVPRNVWLRLEVTRNGNIVHSKVVREDTSAILYEGDVTLQVGNRATLGAGVSLYPFWFQNGFNAAAITDDFTTYTVQPESRDLWLAVTPASGGLRTVKRLFGALGSGTFRTDFLQAADLVPYAPLASPTFTGTPALPTGTTGVTQADADSSTKLASTAYADRVGQQVFGINTQTGTSYTAVLADAGKVIESNNASAMTLTIPPNASVAYPVGTRLRGVRLGAGTLTLTQGASVVLRNRIEAAGTTNRTVSAQYGAWEAYKRATNEWVLTGDIA